MGDFEGLRAAVAGGDGVVARFPGIVCVARGDASDEAHLRRLLDICREVAGSAPGRPLARRLASWLGGSDGPSESLRFGTVSATGEDGLAVFCVGAVSMIAADAGITISGTDAAAWSDRLLARPDSPVLLLLDGTTVSSELPSSVHDLRAGVVPGTAVALLASDARPAALPDIAPPVPAAPERAVAEPAPPPPAPTPAAPEPVAARPAVAAPLPGTPAPQRPGPRPLSEAEQPTLLTPAVAPPPGPDPAAAPRPPRRSDPIHSAPAEESRPPLEVGGAAANGTADESPTSISTPQAQGHLCSRGHLNDPRSHFCVLCGIRMNQQTGVVVLGARPPLGLLVFDDGATYTVDADYLLGRMPEADERVTGGALRPISIDDPSGAVSRVHVEVRLQGWDVLVVDGGSRNGTYVAAPGEEDWVALPPRESRRLTPGTRVRVGGRTFIFESPSGVR